jgi:FkbM family methyltransferase
MLRIAAGPADARQLFRLECSTTAWEVDEEVVAVALRPLGGETVWVRPLTADIYAVEDTFVGRYHVPPVEPGHPGIRRIWDLGSNIGLTVAHLATLFPGAEIRGVELDAENVALCRRNTAPWADRCEIIHAAVWPADGAVEYVRESGNELGFRAEETSEDGEGGRLSAPALSLDTLAEEWPDGRIDLVKMDIEGAERTVLSEATAWAERVDMIMVEVHEPYDVDACRADLGRLGFDVTPHPTHRAGVIGVRPERWAR